MKNVNCPVLKKKKKTENNQASNPGYPDPSSGQENEFIYIQNQSWTEYHYLCHILP